MYILLFFADITKAIIFIIPNSLWLCTYFNENVFVLDEWTRLRAHLFVSPLTHTQVQIHTVVVNIMCHIFGP